MIAVFDSGIWVSVMEFGGTPLDAFIRAIAQDRFGLCDQIEEEVVRVLTHKFGWEAERVRADLAFYWLDERIVTGEPRPGYLAFDVVSGRHDANPTVGSERQQGAKNNHKSVGLCQQS